MNHIILAQELADLYHDRAKYQINIEVMQGLLKDFELNLTPVDGWEGKNQEQRDNAKARALKDSQEYAEMEVHLLDDRRTLIFINAKIESLEAQRRGLEMFTRIRIAEMLTGQSADLDALIDQALNPKPDESELVKSEEIAKNDDRPYCLVHECYNCDCPDSERVPF